MRSRLARLGMVLGTLLAASALIAGPAGASTPEVFGGSATGTALNLSIAGNQLTGGVSQANVKSPLSANAEGTGVLTPGLIQDLKTSVNSPSQADSKPHACAASPAASLPAPLSKILSLDLACSSSSSSALGSNPVSDATGQVAFSNAGDLGALSSQLQSQLSSLASQLEKNVPQLGTALGQIVNSVNTGSIVNAPLGPSESSVTTNAGNVVSKATAQGATINLFTPPAIPGMAAVALQPLLSLTLGSATATATYDRHTGKASGTFDPALLTITQNILPAPAPKTISIVPGQTVSIPPAGSGGPTVLTLKVGAGSTTTHPDGSVESVADGVSLAVLPGQVQGKDLLDLQLAHADASVGGAPPTVSAAHPPTLPFTGEHPWIPFAGLGFLGGALGLGFLAYRGGFRFGFRRS